jgi:DNA (cytosine-5)-methyltransferase 1
MRLLDLFCCEGGAARGYMDAGWDVTGVDLVGRFARRYPGTFIHADALDYVRDHGHEYDAIHASPPCQAYSITRHGHDRRHPELIEPTRLALAATGRPYVIENVVGAPLHDPLMLCWSMFREPGSVLDLDGTPLRMERHRLFESNVPLAAPRACRHPRDVQVAGSYGGARRDKVEARLIRKGGYVPHRDVQADLLGIDWMTQHGMHQSLPPVYTEHIGIQLAAYATMMPWAEPDLFAAAECPVICTEHGGRA